LSLPSVVSGCRHGWQSYVTRVDEESAPMSRNELMEYLQEQGVATRPGTHAVHMLSLYKMKYGIEPEDFPVARNCDQNSMAIPLHNRMNEDDYKYVADCLKNIES